MNSTTAAPSDLLSVFQAFPGIGFLLLPDSPHFTVSAATQEFYRSVASAKDLVEGRSFLSLCGADQNRLAAGAGFLIDALNHSLTHKEARAVPDHQVTISRADGSTVLRHWSGKIQPVLDENNTVLYLLYFPQDLTPEAAETQRMPAWPWKLAAGDSYICLLTGADDRLEMANEPLLQALRQKGGEIGMPLVQLLPEAMSKPLQPLLVQVRKTGQAAHIRELVLPKGNGKDTVIDYFVQPFVVGEDSSSETKLLCLAQVVKPQAALDKMIEESEQRFRSLVTATSDVVYRMSPDWSEMRELQGQGFLTDTGAPIRNWMQKYIPAEQDRIRETIATAIETRTMFEAEHPVLQEDGKLGWTLSRAIPVFNKEGELIEWFGAASNITKRKQMEADLLQSKQETEWQKRRYETITANTPDLIYIFDLEYRFTYANEALLAMWGKSWEEAIGKGLLENGYEPWHAEMHWREIDQVVATKKPIRGEVSFPHATLGSRIYDYIFVPVINENGSVEAIAGTTRDISDFRLAEKIVRESEERFRNLADESPMFVFIIEGDTKTPVTYWNKTWLQYSGQTLEEAIGKAWDEIVHPEDVPAVMANYRPAFERKEPYFIPAIRVRRHDGVYRWHSFKGNPFYLPNGEFNGYVGVGFEIHEQKLGEEAVRESQKQLQQKVEERTAELQRAVEALRRTNQNLEDFAYAASHDMKEPIRKIHFFADRLKTELEGKLSEEQKLFFERLENASRRMGSLIDDLLSYSQATTGVGEHEEVDLNPQIRFVLEDLEIEIQEKNARIHVDPLPVVQGNRRQLQQLFQNLLTNALKYSKPGTPPVILINASEVVGKKAKPDLPPEEGDQVFHLIEVRDNGIGFRQEDAKRIFNVFTRLHGSVEYKGTGVGLSIVQKVVTNHGGYIWAESQPDKGSVFRVLLPVAASDEGTAG